MKCVPNTLLTKITAEQDEVALSYHRVRALYFQAVIFAATTMKIEGTYIRFII